MIDVTLIIDQLIIAITVMTVAIATGPKIEAISYTGGTVNETIIRILSQAVWAYPVLADSVRRIVPDEEDSFHVD